MITTALTNLLNNNSDRRITQDCLDYYRNIPADDRVICSTAFNQDGQMTGIVACQLLIGEHEIKTARLIAVTERSNRQQGLGSALLLQLFGRLAEISIVTNKPVHLIATVASDNVASVRLFTKYGFQIIKEEQATRSSGSFTRLTFELVILHDSVFGRTESI